MAVLQHGAIGNFGATAGDCGDDADRHGVVDLRLAGEQIPHVAVIAQAGAHGLCSVEGAGAACRDDEIHMLVTGLFDECAHEVDAGIGHDVSCFDQRGAWVDALGGGFHGSRDPQVVYVIAAGYKQDGVWLVRFDEPVELIERACAEGQHGGREICERWDGCANCHVYLLCLVMHALGATGAMGARVAPVALVGCITLLCGVFADSRRHRQNARAADDACCARHQILGCIAGIGMLGILRNAVGERASSSASAMVSACTIGWDCVPELMFCTICGVGPRHGGGAIGSRG